VNLPTLDRADLRGRVDKVLSIFLARQRERLAAVDPVLLPLSDALEAFVLGGGKRLRPAFAYWGYRGAGGVEADEPVAAVASLELVQASALIHDDVMDGSNTRRGEPAIHRRFEVVHDTAAWRGDGALFGTAAAILLGDLCLVWSDEMLHASGLDPETLARARTVFDRMRTELTVGQYLDIHTQATGHTSAARASLIAQFKSGKYTVERPLLLGAAIADAAPDVVQAYSRYGLPLGEAFQLRDDLLGVFGDPELTGKPAGDDLREGKRTYLVAMAYEAATGTARADLDRNLGNAALDDTGVARLRDIIITTGALRRTEHRIGELTAEALNALDGADLAAEGRQVLVELATAVTTRAG
jgi:geranylgeranyl diphosphate synthase type I